MGRINHNMVRLLALAALAAAFVALQWLPAGDWLASLERWVGSYPHRGRLAYVALTVTAVVILTPGWIPMMVGGLLFGFRDGLVYGLPAVTVGATLAMLTGRTLARKWVEDRIAGNRRLLALDAALEKRALLIVILTRIALVFPFNLLNYAYGLTRVGVLVYAAGTGLGMLPIVAAYSYLGAIAGDIGAILDGSANPPANVRWLAPVVVVAVTLIVLVVRREVKRALAPAPNDSRPR